MLRSWAELRPIWSSWTYRRHPHLDPRSSHHHPANLSNQNSFTCYPLRIARLRYHSRKNPSVAGAILASVSQPRHRSSEQQQAHSSFEQSFSLQALVLRIQKLLHFTQIFALLLHCFRFAVLKDWSSLLPQVGTTHSMDFVTQVHHLSVSATPFLVELLRITMQRRTQQHFHHHRYRLN